MCTRIRLQPGDLFSEQSNTKISLFIASYEDIPDLCDVINWAYRGKPSRKNPNQSYSGWIGEQHLLIGTRITREELEELIDDEQNVLIVAKMKTEKLLKIVGCCKISPYQSSSKISVDENNDNSVEYGLYAVDPDYQSCGIGTILYNGVIKIAKEYFHARRLYAHIISSKVNQIEWSLRQGFTDTLIREPFQLGDRFQAKVAPEEIIFAIFTKRLD